MTYMVTHFWPGGTEDQYNATIAVAHPPLGLPAGQTYHAAGPTDGGFLVTAVWDSQEQCDTFVRGTLMQSMPDGGFEGEPEQRSSAEVVNVVYG